MHMAQKTDKMGTALRFSRIRERKSLSGVLTNPSFPCKMKGVPDAVRAAGGRFSARPLSTQKGGPRGPLLIAPARKPRCFCPHSAPRLADV